MGRIRRLAGEVQSRLSGPEAAKKGVWFQQFLAGGPCCSLYQCPLFEPRCGDVNHTGALDFVLRARAARKSNWYFGLPADLRRRKNAGYGNLPFLISSVAVTSEASLPQPAVARGTTDIQVEGDQPAFWAQLDYSCAINECQPTGHAASAKPPQPFRKAAMDIRDADVGDVEQISAFLKQLTAAGKRKSPDDEDFVRTRYIDDPDKVRCAVAGEDGVVLGFQSLTRARADNPYGVEPGWGIIGTHIRPSAARRGVGRALFEVIRRSAEAAFIAQIDASIAADNAEGLAYYEAMGFQTYRTPEGLICKRFDVMSEIP